jgi:hypothetical protein
MDAKARFSRPGTRDCVQTVGTGISGNRAVKIEFGTIKAALLMRDGVDETLDDARADRLDNVRISLRVARIEEWV